MYLVFAGTEFGLASYRGEFSEMSDALREAQRRSRLFLNNEFRWQLVVKSTNKLLADRKQGFPGIDNVGMIGEINNKQLDRLIASYCEPYPEDIY